MKAIGWLLLGVGLVWLAYALMLDTSVAVPNGYGWPDRVQNLSLAENRRIHVMLSAGTIIVGTMLIGFSHLQRLAIDDDDAADDDYRECPYCAESVRIEAVMCKHCRSELPAVESDDDIDEIRNDFEGEPASDEGVAYSYRELSEAAEKAQATSGRAGRSAKRRTNKT